MEESRLNSVRQQIDGIDQQLTELFSQRMELASQVAGYKKEHGLPVLAPEREREILVRCGKTVKPELSQYARVLFSTLFDVSRAYQTSLLEEPAADFLAGELMEELPHEATVACQGTEGAYAQLAADRLFRMADIMYFDRFDGVFRAVERGLCRYGVLPVENSIHGVVGTVYDLMQRYRFHIVKSLRMRIEHRLLALPGTRMEDVKEIFSHEQALGQCGAFLEKAGVTATPVENTAIAARKLQQEGRKDAAVIASKACETLYGLKPLAQNISDYESNETRFILISKEPERLAGADRISLILSTEHKPGALYHVLARFASQGLNLTSLTSRPVAGSDFEERFYLDVQASVQDPEVRRLLGGLQNTLPYFQFMGCYREGNA